MVGFENFREDQLRPALKKWFTGTLLQWNSSENQRSMPWKGEKNPYRVWMSEIILQQTRVEQGLSYYNRFIDNFPDIRSLAVAEEEAVFKLWEGLGYYSRCRNMIAAARTLHFEHQGKFPDEIDQIRSLPGVGPYTASAIASFAFDKPHAVLDGNVFRVLSRFFGIYEAIDSTAGRKIFESLSAFLLDATQPAKYNQAIMDFGATVCKPRQPQCETCPLAKKCAALLVNHVEILPVKAKKLVRKTRWFNFLIISNGENILIEKRGPKDIWESLFQFPMIESERIPALNEWSAAAKNSGGSNTPSFLFQQTQQLTHQTIHGRFFVHKTPGNIKAGRWVKVQELDKFPFPRMIAKILPELQLSLR